MGRAVAKPRMLDPGCWSMAVAINVVLILLAASSAQQQPGYADDTVTPTIAYYEAGSAKDSLAPVRGSSPVALRPTQKQGGGSSYDQQQNVHLKMANDQQHVSSPTIISNSRPNPQLYAPIPIVPFAPGAQDARQVGTSGYHYSCPEPKGLFPHPKDCEKFLNCYENRVYILDCPSGLHFNPKRLYCDWPHQAGCKAYPVGGWVSDGRLDKPVNPDEDDYRYLPTVDRRTSRAGKNDEEEEIRGVDAV